jgi:hypothetical protein
MSTPLHRLAIIALLICAGFAGAWCAASTASTASTAATAAAPDPHQRVRGMTISCHGSGQSWGSDEMVASMAELRAMGVNWIAIHPYGGIDNDGTIGDPHQSRMYADPTWLRRPIEEAHRLGMKIMIKPHIAYWGSHFSWRGEIAFKSAEEWDHFFETYTAWILRVAEITHDADAFVVGTELDKTVHREREWRDIIAKIREHTDAPLTYAANWDSYERVPFWDALDVIGVQAYFPLVDHDGLPTDEELDRGWSRVMDQLHAFSTRFGKKILLAELGYNDSADAAVRPWEYRRGGENAELIQQRCLRASLRAVEHDDTVVGAFLWKWFPGGSTRGNFLKSTPAMRAVIRETWEPHRLPR